ncbi:hypothetical protein IJ556_08260, partial [bacterium]|nr:hypothetical protein [bacterium]
MGKKLLFNYFMHKACCIEQELLGIQDERATLLAVIFSKFSVPHQHATGCCEETVYMTDPKFAQELFIILCIDAKKHGDNLVEAFRFVPWTLYYKGSILSGIEDKDLTNYLDKTLFPAVCDSILKPFYRALIPDKTVEQLQEVYYRQNR